MQKSRDGQKIVTLISVAGMIALLAIAGFLYRRHAMEADRLAGMIEAARARCMENAAVILEWNTKYGGISCSESPLGLGKMKLISQFERTDPWGNEFQIDVFNGIVYSKGPDGLDKRIVGRWGESKLDLTAPENVDNISADYIGPARIRKVQIEVNPEGEPDPAKAFDVVHLFFSCRVRLAGARLDLVLDATEKESAGAASDAAVAEGKILRWRLKKDGPPANPRTLFKRRSADGAERPAETVPLVYSSPTDPASAWSGAGLPGRLYHSEDSREIVLSLPEGTSGSIVPGSCWIDLTGGEADAPAGNPFFKRNDGVTGALRSEVPIRIEVYE